MMCNEIMKLKAEAETETERVIKKLDKAGRAKIYCSSNEIGEFEMSDEGITFKPNPVGAEHLTYSEERFSYLMVNYIICWSHKRYICKEHVSKNSPNIITKESILKCIKEFDCNNTDRYLTELKHFDSVNLAGEYDIGICFIGPMFINWLCNILKIISDSTSSDIYFDIREIFDILLRNTFDKGFASNGLSDMFSLTLQEVKKLKSISRLEILDEYSSWFFTDSVYEVLTIIKKESEFMYYILNYYCEYIIYNDNFKRTFFEYKIIQCHPETKNWEFEYKQVLNMVNQTIDMYSRLIKYKDYVIDYFKNGNGKEVISRVQLLKLDSDGVDKIMNKIEAFDFSDCYMENDSVTFHHNWFYKTILNELDNAKLY